MLREKEGMGLSEAEQVIETGHLKKFQCERYNQSVIESNIE
jgi:hypothetical protein